MSTVQTSHYCATCQRQTLHSKEKPNHLLHLVLSVLTVGIWAIFVWLPATLKPERGRCTFCGSKPGVESLKHEMGIGQKSTLEPPAASSSDPPPSDWLPPGARPPRS